MYLGKEAAISFNTYFFISFFGGLPHDLPFPLGSGGAPSFGSSGGVLTVSVFISYLCS